MITTISLDNFDHCLMVSIEGLRGKELWLENVADRTRGVIDWNHSELFLPVRFEDVIGVRGGGELARQLVVFREFADHLGVVASDERIQRAASDMFGEGHSFRKGQIGGWHEVFKDEHRQCFKELAGDLLIELGYEQNTDW